MNAIVILICVTLQGALPVRGGYLRTVAPLLLATVRVSFEQSTAQHLNVIIRSFAIGNGGKVPGNWDELEAFAGIGLGFEAKRLLDIKRRFIFVRSKGVFPFLSSYSSGPIDGTIVLLPVLPRYEDERSTEHGRYVILQQDDSVMERWITESELHAFSNWKDVEAKLEVAKAERQLKPDALANPLQTQGANDSGLTPNPPDAPSGAPNANQQPAPSALFWKWVIVALIAAIGILMLRGRFRKRR